MNHRAKHGLLWFVLCLVVCHAPVVLAADAVADSAAANGESWLDRTLDRFFGGQKQYGDSRPGGADPAPPAPRRSTV